MPNPTSSLPDLATIAMIAKEAGELSLRYFRGRDIGDLGISEKSNNAGLVTVADVACEKHIVSRIREFCPQHLILGEEGGLQGKNSSELLDGNLLTLEDLAEGDIFWCVDPIDGTTNFSNGNAYFCVSIGVGRKERGQVTLLLGAIFHPMTGDMYTAERGTGAWCNDIPIQVKRNIPVNLASFATGFASAKGESLEQITNLIFKIQNKSMGLRINGAAALDLALTARSVVHGFFESALQPWDMAAGALLASEAGAKVTNYAGEPFCLLRDSNIIAAHESLHIFLVEAINSF